MKQQKGWRTSCDIGEAMEGWRMSCGVGEVTERLENELCSAHSPTFPSLHLRHNSFSNPSVTLPMPQLILQRFCCFTYITVHSPTLLSLLLRHSSLNSPGEPPMLFTVHLEYSSVSIMKYNLEQQMFIYDNFVKYESWRKLITNFCQSFPNLPGLFKIKI